MGQTCGVLIYDLDYSNYVELLGTAHFTVQSVQEAAERVKLLKPNALAIELDPQRYSLLRQRCLMCPLKDRCSRKCEFIVAADALGNVDADVWFIDMSEYEIHQRMRMWSQIYGFTYSPTPIRHRKFIGDDLRATRLWEAGRKEEALDLFERGLYQMKQVFPAGWRVLIEERNLLMAARLAWILTKYLDEGATKPKVLALVGAAHVKEIREYLQRPFQIPDRLHSLSLRFTEPYRIRRICVS